MVSAIALQLVEEGVLSLADPLPDIAGVSPDVTRQLTLRRLLAHASGLVDYRATPGYSAESILTAVDAVNLAVPASDPQSRTTRYSATNYLLVGLLLEQVTGQSLEQLVQTRIAGPFGLRSTRLVDNTRAGFVGFASGGVVSTLPDLATWFDALLRRRSVLSDRMLRAMLYGGHRYQRSAGLGMWRACPCRRPTNKSPEPFALAFHDGGDIRVAYIPSRDVVLALRLSEPLYDERQLADRLMDATFAIVDRRREPDRRDDRPITGEPRRR
jgi:CubicO group peptidase (beta-lactamase class C family)